jgi:predicted AlkP superfamily phosphohydrolase/phosphomutase
MKKILAIALDAAEPSLIEKWTSDGTLPALKKLIDQGAYGRLASPAEWMSGSSWPTFYTGKNPANHGFYNYLVWNPQKMQAEPPTPERMPLRPFWRDIKDPNGPRITAVDIPLTYGTEPFNGREIISLATHDTLVPTTGYPREFVDTISKRYGADWMSNEKYGVQSKKEFTGTRDEMIDITKKLGGLCEDLLKQSDWDLFITSFASIHRGGHRLWGLQNIEESLTPAERIKLADAQRQIYIACDQAIASMIERVEPGTTILVFSLHGMGENANCTPMLPEMLRRILADAGPDASSPPPGLLDRLRAFVSIDIRHRLKQAMPVSLRHKLTAFWRRHRSDWGETSAFSMMADVQGWIRVNLKGRERLGIVNPGKEYDDLCETIANGLKTFTDADTGKPIVQSIVRAGQVFEGDHLDMLPDIMVQWQYSPVHERRAVHSPRYGTIPFPLPGRNPDGRSGNHRYQGMLIAAGEGIKSGNISNGHILDLAPTILALLGQPVPADMEGKPLSIIKQ